MRRRLKLAALGLAVVLAALDLVVAWVLSWPDFGGALEGERLARAKRSKQWRDGAFANEPPPPASDLAVNLKEMMGSGDTGYGPHFAEIGRQRGPIDLALIKIGDYGNDAAWESIHMVPEDSIRAHVDLGAATLLPIHWGTFQLSYHAWDAPIRRAVAAAKTHGVAMVTPRLGEVVTVGAPFDSTPWWEALSPAR